MSAMSATQTNQSVSAEPVNDVGIDGDLGDLQLKCKFSNIFLLRRRCSAICKLSKCQLSYLWPSADIDTRIHKTPDTRYQIANCE